MLTGPAAAQPHYALPGAAVRESPESLTFRYEGEGYSYAAGLGWLNLDAGLSAPIAENGQVYLEDDVLDVLGVALPRLSSVRSSGGGTVRVVFDFGALDAGRLEPLRKTGTLTPERPLRLRLPPLLVARTLRERLEGFRLQVAGGAGATILQLAGPTARYTAFPLANPTRLVIDLKTDLRADPDAADALLDAQESLLNRLTRPREGVRELGGGVTLRSFSTPTVAGSSRVDLVEIAPNRGRFRVEGGSYDLRTPSELTGAALVGLNASYFDPESGRSIGFLKGRGGLESLPSRGRAAVGFGFGDPVVGRPEGTLEVTVTSDAGTSVIGNLASGDRSLNTRSLNNRVRRLELGLLEERVTLHTVPGAWVGSPRQGAVVVSAAGRVLENKVGPRRVPAGGFVLSYLPEVRTLALVNAGARLSYRLETRPSIWRFVPEAVEAGPLLVSSGRSAYRPGLEAFDTRDRGSNINRRTTRAALGVRADGTVLLLVATELTAAELVPLFLRLGAEDALQLDSGGSSTLVVGGEVINRPALLQRRVATVITYTPLSAAALTQGRE